MWHRQHYTVKDSLRTLQTSWFCIQRINHVSLHWHYVMAYNHTMHWKTASSYTSQEKREQNTWCGFQNLDCIFHSSVEVKAPGPGESLLRPCRMEPDRARHKQESLINIDNSWLGTLGCSYMRQALTSSLPSFKNMVVLNCQIQDSTSLNSFLACVQHDRGTQEV